jgi:iron(III) transport system substrate-binding protein
MPLFKKSALFAVVVALFATILTGCSSSDEQATDVTELTVYSGRSEEFIAPFFAQWEAQSGITLNIRYGDSAELAAQILEEGSNSPADLFLSQDAANRNWVGVTGRARVFAYAPDRVKVLPQSVTDLTNSQYKNQIGIAPTNASFQAFLTALIENKGAEFAKNWLKALQANGVKIYAKNSAIVEAIDKGEISIGLVNHYYIWEVSEGLGRAINVKNGASQAKFVTDTHEYSLISGAAAPAGVPALDQIGAPAVDLATLKNIKATQDLLIEVGLL